MAVRLTPVEEAIGYRFAGRELLDQALTHRSYAQEKGRPGADYERLEFLGDAVLGFLVSEGLMQRYPGASEGRLTKLKAHLVRWENLAAQARELHLGESLRLGRGELSSGGRGKPTLLADAFEALIGAVYLDGGLAAARSLIERTVLRPESLAAAEQELPLGNARSVLQEALQKRGLPEPEYRTVSETGPSNQPAYTVEVRLHDSFRARGEGPSKKAAAMNAARLAVIHLRETGMLPGEETGSAAKPSKERATEAARAQEPKIRSGDEG